MSDFLVLQAARFGDLVQTKRLILTLLQRGHVHLLIDQSLASLAQKIYPHTEIHPMHFHGQIDANAIRNNRQTLQELDPSQFQTVYNCNFSKLTTALCRRFAPEQIAGYKPSYTAAGGIVGNPWTKLIFRMTARRFASTLNLIDFWGYFVPNPLAPEQVCKQAQAGGQGIGVVLAGRESRRSLPIPLLAQMLKIVLSKSKTPTLFLLGTKTEQKAAHQLLRAMPLAMQSKIQDLTGKTDWAALIDVLQGLDLLLTPDTGTMHLAAHLGVPVQAFFLSSACCHETGPYGQGHWVWQTAPQCAPCLESAPCTQHMQCLTPFQSKEFSRLLAWHCEHSAQNTTQELPPNLQLWHSELDKLGSKFTLEAGTDHFATERKTKRHDLAKFVKLPSL